METELNSIVNSFINTTTNDPKIAENLEELLSKQENADDKKKIFIWLCYYVSNYLFKPDYYKDLIERYNKFVENKDELDGHIYFLIAVIKESLNYPKQETLADYESSVEYAQNGLLNWATLGDIYAEASMSKAIKSYKKAINNFTTNSDSLFDHWIRGNDRFVKESLEKKLTEITFKQNRLKLITKLHKILEYSKYLHLILFVLMALIFRGINTTIIITIFLLLFATASFTKGITGFILRKNYSFRRHQMFYDSSKKKIRFDFNLYPAKGNRAFGLNILEIFLGIFALLLLY